MTPTINFDTINELNTHCTENNIIPVIEYRATKNVNMRDEYLHEVSGSFMRGGQVLINFVVDEMCAFKEKRTTVLLS